MTGCVQKITEENTLCLVCLVRWYMLGEEYTFCVLHTIIYYYRVSSVHAYQLPYSVQWDSVIPVPSHVSQRQGNRDTQTHTGTHGDPTHIDTVAGITRLDSGISAMGVMVVMIQIW